MHAPPSPAPLPELLAQSDVRRERQFFVNRNLRMDQVDLVGFDMDYTLAVYHKRRVEDLSFQMTLDRLVRERGYPVEIGAIRYDPDFVIRGLVIDKETGNIFKVDRHNHVGRCYHGRRRLSREERRAAYRQVRIRLDTPRFAWIDTLFALPEACLYAFIVDRVEASGGALDYRKLYDDIRATIDAVHRDGSLKAVLTKDLGHYIVRDPELGPALHKLRSAGKKLLLATNSFHDYTDAVMRFLLDGMLPEYPDWRRYFDFVVVGTRKPDFFTGAEPFLELDRTGTPFGEASSLERGRAYQGGNLALLEKMTGFSGDRVLYVGDHIYGDIVKSKRTSLWRTCLVVQELEGELAHVERMAPEIRRLHELEALRAGLDDELNQARLSLPALERRLERANGGLTPEARASLEEEVRRGKGELERLRRGHRAVAQEADALEARVEDSHNPCWGLLFKEGHENSRFGQQVEDYACLYTSRASNFLYHSPVQYFRAPRELMPHERP